MMSPVYVYRATLKRVIDGDTFELHVDLGFHVTAAITVRLRGLYAAETGQPGGAEATARASRAFAGATTIIVQTVKTKGGKDVQTFARYVADVYLDGQSLAEMLTGTA